MFKRCFVLAGLVAVLPHSSVGALNNLGTVLPLGDSITSGDITVPPYVVPGAWRDPFYQDALAQGVAFQFVGTTDYNATPLLTAAGESYHSGYEGDVVGPAVDGRGSVDDVWTDQAEGASHLQPNWILLMAGGNNLFTGQTDITAAYLNLLSTIHTDSPASHIICGSTPPDTALGTAAVASVNTQIVGVVATAQSRGWPVSFSDVGNSYTTADLVDAYHPGQTGDDLLGAAWLKAVVAQRSVPANGHAVIATSTIAISGSSGQWTSQLDLKASDLIVRGGNLSQLTNQIAQGRAQGGWTGNGIISSKAAADTRHLTGLGVIQNVNANGTVLYPSFDGVSCSAGDVLVRYTYYGDANLDGSVTSTDYTRVDNGFLSNGSLTGWYNGDFNYDGVVNGSDYSLIDNTFDRQGGSLAAAETTAEIASVEVVPEPSGLVILMPLGAFISSRRRRRENKIGTKNNEATNSAIGPLPERSSVE